VALVVAQVPIWAGQGDVAVQDPPVYEQTPGSWAQSAVLAQMVTLSSEQ
jgi:hypothetical protein